MCVDKELLYTKDHEWIDIDGKFGRIGITNHAQTELGDIIFVELPQIGDKFIAGDVFGTLEAVKTVADLYMPLDGEIVEINQNLESEPESINTDAYNEGWIAKIKISNIEKVKELLSSDDYNKLIK